MRNERDDYSKYANKQGCFLALMGACLAGSFLFALYAAANLSQTHVDMTPTPIITPTPERTPFSSGTVVFNKP